MSANQLWKDHRLQLRKTEGKASCWILSFLGNIAGAVADLEKPTPRERLLDYYLRNELYQMILQHLDTTFEEDIDSGQQLLSLEMLEKLHLLPVSATRRGSDKYGWVPGAGWAGTFVYTYLTKYAAVSNPYCAPLVLPVPCEVWCAACAMPALVQ